MTFDRLGIRLLAMAPPAGPVEPDTVEWWLKAGIQPYEIALVLREPQETLEGLVGPNARLAALAERCRLAEIPILLGCVPEDVLAAVSWVERGAADGLHLRGDPDPATAEASRRGLPRGVIGRAVHGEPTLVPVPVDYTVFAPVFHPRTPQGGVRKQPAGLDALSRWCEAVTEPVFALGGIEPDNAEACLRAGAHGLAGIRCFFGDPGRVIEDGARLRAAVNAHPSLHAPVSIRP